VRDKVSHPYNVENKTTQKFNFIIKSTGIVHLYFRPEGSLNDTNETNGCVKAHDVKGRRLGGSVLGGCALKSSETKCKKGYRYE
jgi:hypothetical protein